MGSAPVSMEAGIVRRVLFRIDIRVTSPRATAKETLPSCVRKTLWSLFVLTVLHDLARFGKQAVVFAAAHGCLGILQGIVLDDVPVRIAVRNVPFQQQVILQQSNGVRMVLVEVILHRDRRHVQGQDRVGQNEVCSLPLHRGSGQNGR